MQPAPPLGGETSLTSDPLTPQTPQTTSSETSLRPTLDIDRNSKYREESLHDLAELSNIFKPETHGLEANDSVKHYLDMSTLPVVDTVKHMREIRLFTMEEARELVEGNPLKDPVAVNWSGRDWRPKSWPKSRPIEQFCQLLVGDKTTICVQTPSQLYDEPSFKETTLGEVIKTFLTQETPSSDPINALDLHCPFPCVRPPFLNDPNCMMLDEIKRFVLSNGSAQRITADSDKYKMWHEWEQWALLSQGGNTTAPHTDSHGLATWIAPQEAGFGFGWLSRSTRQEFIDWVENRLSYQGGRWRYIFLQPGQAVFFPSGTIHYVFRTREHQTLAFGGHILQWSNTNHWLDVLELQIEFPNSTNEDMGEALVQMLKAVDTLLGEKITRGNTSFFNGKEKAKAIQVRVKVCGLEGDPGEDLANLVR